MSSDTLQATVATFRCWLDLPDPGALYVVLATVAANRAEGDPVWLLVVGPPGGGKTEVLNPLASLSDVYPAATLTEASLLSGTPGKERAKDAKGGLLREIGPFGIVVLKDFGSILSMNRDTRAALLAALREVYDGAWTRHVGTDGGRTLSWSGKVGLIAGSTPAIDSHHAVVGSMGERFVLYRLPTIDPANQTRQALRHVGREALMRRELGDAVRLALAATVESMLTVEPDEMAVERLIDVASIAVRCRSAIERDNYRREIELIPDPEAPARLALVLLRLHNALLAIGVDAVTTWKLIAKCALDSMPAIRRRMLAELLRRPGGVTTSEVSDATDYPTQTARRALEDLTAHGIAHKAAAGPGRPDLWRVTEWALERWQTIAAIEAGTVPEMSDGPDRTPSEEQESGSLFTPTRVVSDKTGKVAASLEEVVW